MVTLGREENYLGTRQDDLARDEDEKHDLWLDHAVDQTREQLRIYVSTEIRTEG